MEILKNYQKQYPDKIIAIDLKENMRQGGARNIGMKSTNSEYTGFVDAGDFVHLYIKKFSFKRKLKFNMMMYLPVGAYKRLFG